MPLTLTDFAVVLPQDRHRLAGWTEMAEAQWSAPAATGPAGYRRDVYGEVIALMFAPTGTDPLTLIAGAAFEEAAFPCAGLETQADLALGAVKSLPAAAAPDLLLYAASSVDERIFRSSVGWIASETGSCRVPHFAVGQLHGAALAGGLAIVEAMLDAGDDTLLGIGEGGDIAAPPRSAVFVAAEKWPLPCPRHFMAGSVLGDAAVALRATTAIDVPGLRLLSVANRSFASFACVVAGTVSVDAEALENAVVTTIQGLLDRVDPCDIYMMPSAFGRAFDDRIAIKCGMRRVEPGGESNFAAIDYGAASVPMELAKVLDAVRNGDICGGMRICAWGASFSGAVGAVLVASAAAAAA